MIFIIELSISDVNAKWKEFILVSACELHKKIEIASKTTKLSNSVICLQLMEN